MAAIKVFDSICLDPDYATVNKLPKKELATSLTLVVANVISFLLIVFYSLESDLSQILIFFSF